METSEISQIPVIANPFQIIAERLSKIENILLEIRSPQSSKEDVPVFYSQTETAKILHCSVVTIISYRKKQWITGRRVGSRILFTQADIDSAVKTIAVEKYRRV